MNAMVSVYEDSVMIRSAADQSLGSASITVPPPIMTNGPNSWERQQRIPFGPIRVSKSDVFVV